MNAAGRQTESQAPAGPGPSRWPVRLLVLAVLLAASALAFGAASLRRHNLTAAGEDATPAGRARADILFLETMVRHYTRVTGALPSEEQGLEALMEHRLLKTLPLDPWGHPYVYRVEGRRGTVHSLGRDGQVGGKGEDADIRSPARGQPPEAP
jgi:general secretion pathway protein G